MLRHDSFFFYTVLSFCTHCSVSCCGSASRVVLVSSQSCNLRNLALPLAVFPLSGVRGVFSGAHPGTTAFLCVHLLKPARKGAVLGDVGVCLCSPSFTYQSQAAAEGLLWLSSDCGLCLAARPEARALPGQHSVPSQRHGLCCLGIPEHADWWE